MLASTSRLVIAMITIGAMGCGAGSTAASRSGGATGAGGLQGDGGSQGKGGEPGQGGEPGVGGSRGEGGASSSGGTQGSGGLQGKGGTQATGGAGGTQGSGGTPGRGGTPGTGGLQGTGGVQGQGGTAGAGAAPGTGGTQGKGGGGPGAGGGPGSGGTRGTGGASGSGGSTAKCPEGWTLAWSDEFDGTAGSAADSSKWNYDSGPNWYNGELQYYSQGTGNAKLDGSGNLVIEARKETREGKQYTSARLKTEGKKTFTYGRFEGRMKLPYGQGMWPAFWMLGGNNWPTTGEIDIMENLGREPSIAHGTMHGPGYSGAAGPTASYTLPDGAKFSDDFHVFAIEWESSAIRWYVDGKLYSTKTQADIGGNSWVFNHAFFFILNVAVGGEWPGNPDSTTVFPQQMLIDYVRVCQR
jgi:beta-glucanase (GH16 family)